MLDSPKELAFDRLTRLASQLLKAPISLVTIPDEGRQFFKSSYGLHEPWESDRQTPLTHSICQYVVREDAPIIVHDTLTDCRLTENLAREDIGVGSYLGVPLHSGGQAIGALCVIDEGPRNWGPAEVQSLGDLAYFAVTEIELRRRAMDLEIVNATLKSTLKEQRHHLGIAAHDLRSPLSVILAYSELLQEGLKSSEERELIQQVIQSTEFMQSLVGNILDLESVRSGAPLPMKVQLLAPIIARCVSAHDVLARQQNISIGFEGRECEAYCILDAVRIEQAVNNLLGNALKFSPSGTRVLVKLLTKGVEAMVQVIDSGPGISEELLPFVFEPFRQGATRDQGVGLGLAIVDAVAKSHGGSIQVESGPNRGCCFTVSLPLGVPPG